MLYFSELIHLIAAGLKIETECLFLIPLRIMQYDPKLQHSYYMDLVVRLFWYYYCIKRQ